MRYIHIHKWVYRKWATEKPYCCLLCGKTATLKEREMEYE